MLRIPFTPLPQHLSRLWFLTAAGTCRGLAVDRVTTNHYDHREVYGGSLQFRRRGATIRFSWDRSLPRTGALADLEGGPCKFLYLLPPASKPAAKILQIRVAAVAGRSGLTFRSSIVENALTVEAWAVRAFSREKFNRIRDLWNEGR